MEQRELLDIGKIGHVATLEAVDAVRSVGDLRASATEKANANDLVTAADLASETAVVDFIKARRPQDGFLMEESGDATNDARVVWIVDPLDGTTNRTRGIPLSAVSIGARVNGRPVGGWVYDLDHDVLYEGLRGQGAFRTDMTSGAATRLERKAGRMTVKNALIQSMGAYSEKTRAIRGHILQKVLADGGEVRVLGSTALSICLVATGTFDGSLDIDVGEWDFAAGQVIATEAGCKMASPDNQSVDRRFVITAAPGMMPALQQLASHVLTPSHMGHGAQICTPES